MLIFRLPIVAYFVPSDSLSEHIEVGTIRSNVGMYNVSLMQEMDGQNLGGQQVKVSEAKPKGEGGRYILSRR